MSPRAMTRYVFEEVRVPSRKSVACSGCGKNVRRSTTFREPEDQPERRAGGGERPSGQAPSNPDRAAAPVQRTPEREPRRVGE